VAVAVGALPPPGAPPWPPLPLPQPPAAPPPFEPPEGIAPVGLLPLAPLGIAVGRVPVMLPVGRLPVGMLPPPEPPAEHCVLLEPLPLPLLVDELEHAVSRPRPAVPAKATAPKRSPIFRLPEPVPVLAMRISSLPLGSVSRSFLGWNGRHDVRAR
jgi:hypothetical protein